MPRMLRMALSKEVTDLLLLRFLEVATGAEHEAASRVCMIRQGGTALLFPRPGGMGSLTEAHGQPRKCSNSGTGRSHCFAGGL